MLEEMSIMLFVLCTSTNNSHAAVADQVREEFKRLKKLGSESSKEAARKVRELGLFNRKKKDIR